MSTLVQSASARQHARWNPLLLPALGLAVFLALPWPLNHKVHVALHGLCAQRVSHTYRFGGELLPFDARMTGIYLGAVATMAVLVMLGAHRFAKQPDRSRLTVLSILGATMAVDGVNSLLTDMRLPHPYTTTNWMRLITGMGAGMVLGVALIFLIATTLWRRPDLSRQTIHSWRTPGLIAAALAPVVALVLSGWEPLYVPLALILLLSALAVLSTLSLIMLVIVRRRDYSFVAFSDLGHHVTWALASGATAMAVLSCGRLLLEHAAGGSPLK